MYAPRYWQQIGLAYLIPRARISRGGERADDGRISWNTFADLNRINGNSRAPRTARQRDDGKVYIDRQWLSAHLRPHSLSSGVNRYFKFQKCILSVNTARAHSTQISNAIVGLLRAQFTDKSPLKSSLNYESTRVKARRRGSVTIAAHWKKARNARTASSTPAGARSIGA